MYWNVAVDRSAVLTEFDNQMRRNPALEPGTCVEREERITRIISSGDGWSGVLWTDLTEADADAMIVAQVSRFAELAQPWEWKYYSYDQPAELPGRLQAAGFIPDPAETLLVAEIADLNLDMSPPAGVELVPVTDADGAAAVVQVHDEVFGGHHAAIGLAILAGLESQPRSVEAVVAVAGDTAISAGRVEFPEDSDFASLWGGGGHYRAGEATGCSGRWSPTAPAWPGSGATGTCRSTPPQLPPRSSNGWALPSWLRQHRTDTPGTRSTDGYYPSVAPWCFLFFPVLPAGAESLGSGRRVKGRRSRSRAKAA
jgi:hypothetical protein